MSKASTPAAKIITSSKPSPLAALYRDPKFIRAYKRALARERRKIELALAKCKPKPKPKRRANAKGAAMEAKRG